MTFGQQDVFYSNRGWDRACINRMFTSTRKPLSPPHARQLMAHTMSYWTMIQPFNLKSPSDHASPAKTRRAYSELRRCASTGSMVRGVPLSTAISITRCGLMPRLIKRLARVG